MSGMAAAHSEPIGFGPGSIAAEAGVADGSGDARWMGLFRIAGIGAILTGILIPLQIVAFIVWPLPSGGVLEWFELFQDSPLVGLVSFDLVILLEEILLIPITLGLYLLLRRGSESLMLIARRRGS